MVVNFYLMLESDWSRCQNEKKNQIPCHCANPKRDLWRRLIVVANSAYYGIQQVKRIADDVDENVDDPDEHQWTETASHV